MVLTHRWAAPHVDMNYWQETGEQAEREDVSFGDTNGSDRDCTGTTIGVGEPEFMA